MELGISSLGHIIDIARKATLNDLTELLHNATEQCLNFAEKNGIEIVELVIEPPQVFNDEYKQKFINLVNSCKAGAYGCNPGVSESPSI